MSLSLRQSLGIAEGASVSATFADLSRIAADSPYVLALTEILKGFPEHFHLFLGPGNVKGVRTRLHSEGVLTRVRFMGNMTDTEPVLAACDVYLACFPDGDPIMADAGRAGKPSVAMGNSAASAPAGGHHTVGTISDFIEVASRLIRKATKAHAAAHLLST